MSWIVFVFAVNSQPVRAAAVGCRAWIRPVASTVQIVSGTRINLYDKLKFIDNMWLIHQCVTGALEVSRCGLEDYRLVADKVNP